MKSFDFEGYSKKQQYDVLDMKRQMDKVGEALANDDATAAQQVVDYLSGKQEDYWTSGYGNYEIITCQDFAYDVAEALKSGDKQEVDSLKKRYQEMYGSES